MRVVQNWLRALLNSELESPLLKAFAFERDPLPYQILAVIANRSPWVVVLANIMKELASLSS